VFPVELVVCKLLTNGSIRYAGFVRDITARLFHEHELKTRKEAAEAALHMKEAFFNAISHDLRTPLNAIALNAQVIQMKKNHCDEEILEAADSIRENAHGAATMLNGFLEFARASQDKNKISSIDLDSILRKIHSSYQSKVALKKLHFDIPTMTGIVINTDESKLVKIIENLVDNAVKFTFAGGIVVQVAKEDKSIRISIADTGIGISDKNAYLLFNEFFQVNNYERDRAKGVGLGLAIARTLAEQIGGNIKLAYTNDAGSRFDVIIRGESPYASIDSGGRQVCSPSNENTNAR
jgi:signal transduction histidine kinase